MLLYGRPSGLQTMSAAVFMSGLLCAVCTTRFTYLCNEIWGSTLILWFYRHDIAKNVFQCIVRDCTCTNWPHELIYVCLSVELELQKMNKVMCNPVWIYFESIKFSAPCSTSALLCLGREQVQARIRYPSIPRGSKFYFLYSLWQGFSRARLTWVKVWLCETNDSVSMA